MVELKLHYVGVKLLNDSILRLAGELILSDEKLVGRICGRCRSGNAPDKIGID